MVLSHQQAYCCLLSKTCLLSCFSRYQLFRKISVDHIHYNGERDVAWNHRRLHCLFISWFSCKSNKTSKLRVTGLCAGNSPVTGEFPAQKVSNAENVAIWWRHRVTLLKSGDEILWKITALTVLRFSIPNEPNWKDYICGMRAPWFMLIYLFMAMKCVELTTNIPAPYNFFNNETHGCLPATM